MGKHGVVQAAHAVPVRAGVMDHLSDLPGVGNSPAGHHFLNVVLAGVAVSLYLFGGCHSFGLFFW